MLVFGTKQETLPVAIAKDVSTGLPLISEEDDIFELILAYLALPYSVAEYGCGKKASMLIEYLLNLGIPPFALARGLVMERDMSPAALDEVDARRRRHALVLDNPLFSLANLGDPRLCDALLEACPGVEIHGDEIHAGGYVLHHEANVQFALARTHIFTILTFWDEENCRAVRRVLDPTQDKTGSFPISQVREFLHAPEALIFRAPLLGRFRLDSRELTVEQRRRVAEILDDEESAALPAGLSAKRHADLIRKLTGAEPGTIGDPATWTYANNISAEQLGHASSDQLDEPRSRRTGRGDPFFQVTERLLAAREARTGDVPVVLAELNELIDASRVRQVAREDALWAESQLEVLANVAVAIVYYNSLTHIARILQGGQDITTALLDRKELIMLRGTGVRLRRRIDRAGSVSREEDGRIDARALTPGFVRATIETIREMRRAGLSVAVDRVGNLHGLTLTPDEAAGVAAGDVAIKDLLGDSIVFGSHIDTVNDAGKFDGRLGVLAGIETAHVLRDLEKFFELPVLSSPGGAEQARASRRPRIVVSAFIGEEMTFTGQGVSMPGSAAVCGQARVDQVHAMLNGDGERWGDLLPPMLREIAAAAWAGEIDVLNRFAADEDALPAACFDPTDFYSPHSYERHIEQGPILDRHNVPMVLVDVIMGIYQEDFLFRGDRAEAAALEMNRRLRELVLEMLAEQKDVRLTSGIFEGLPDYEGRRTQSGARPAEHANDIPSILTDGALVMRWTLEGEMNHAGATPTPDRRDPGVAAGRLAREFESTIAEISGGDLRPLIANLRTTPGTNRNVIPGAVSFSMGVAPAGPESDAKLSVEQRADLIHRLQAFVAGTLSKPVDRGGEGLDTYRMHEESFLAPAGAARLSIDLRSASTALTEAFLERVRAATGELEREYGVTITGEQQQRLNPSPLEDSGQVLFMERSYGGSHNPRETELLDDLVRGCVLQIAVAREILNMRDGLPDDFHLFRLVEAKLPRPWVRELARFTSGALHDTCNVAAAYERSQSRT